MEHEHVVTSELTDISNRLRALGKHVEDGQERQQWQKACAEIETLLLLVSQRIGERGVF